jgi:hypothetical protein
MILSSRINRTDFRKLHVFTYASQSAYDACAYIVTGKEYPLVIAQSSSIETNDT